MRLTKSSIRGNGPEDMMRFAMSAKSHSALKQLARKQQRARERQFFLREDLLEAKDALSRQWKVEAAAKKFADHNLALLLQDLTKTKMVKRHRRHHRKNLERQDNDYSLTRFTDRQVLVRFVSVPGSKPETQVFASCAV